MIAHKEVPDDMLVCHTCDNPRCVNPEHLFLGTHKDNAEDRRAKGRSRTTVGKENGHAKLTEADVLEIRELHAHGMNQCDIGKKFGVTHSAIHLIVKRKNWTHI